MPHALAGPVIVGTGGAVTTTGTGADVAEQPAAFVTVTLKFPVAETVIACVVAPFDHAYAAMPAGAVSVTLPGLQKLVGPDEVTVAVGGAVTFTVCEAEAGHVAALTVTVKVVVATTGTVIVCVVAPVDQA